MLRQEGKTSGQGALDGSGAADEEEPGETVIGTETEPGNTDVDTEAEPGKTDVGTEIGALSVTVVGVAGLVLGCPGIKVVGGASVHFVHTVTVEVRTVSVMVTEVVVIVLEPEVVVSVTGHNVVVV